MLQLLGIDFTSAPRPAKPITVACGHLDGARVVLDGFERCADWPSFEALLTRPGPWLGAFDFPFGLPREAIIERAHSLMQLNVANIEPTAHPSPVFGRMRNDEPHESLPPAAVLQNAPDQAQSQIRVPKVVTDA